MIPGTLLILTRDSWIEYENSSFAEFLSVMDDLEKVSPHRFVRIHNDIINVNTIEHIKFKKDEEYAFRKEKVQAGHWP